MWTRNAARRLVALGLHLEIRKRDAEVIAIAVDELHFRARAECRKRRGHERVGRAQHRLARDTGEMQGRQAHRPPNWTAQPPGHRCTKTMPARSVQSCPLRTSGSSRSRCRSVHAGVRDRVGQSQSRTCRSPAFGKRLMTWFSGRPSEMREKSAPAQQAVGEPRALACQILSGINARRQACQTGRTVPSSTALSDVRIILSACAVR